MNEALPYEGIILQTTQKIEEQRQKKQILERKEASDFNFLNFFTFGENKLSLFLKFLLNPIESHGQGDIFLRIFLAHCGCEEKCGRLIEIVSEKIITNGRRIDIWIEFEGFTIAIENKLWAKDQNHQMLDYSKYLIKNSRENFLLIYLNPYGFHPKQHSISQIDFKNLENRIKILSYKGDMFKILQKWKNSSQANKVTFFIEQLESNLKSKITPNFTFEMTKHLTELIYRNKLEIEALVRAYDELKISAAAKLHGVSVEMRQNWVYRDGDIKSGFEGPFKNDSRTMIFKVFLEFNNNRIWLQLLLEEISFRFHYYEEDDFDGSLLNYLKDENIGQLKHELSPELSKYQMASKMTEYFLFLQDRIKKHKDRDLTSEVGH